MVLGRWSGGSSVGGASLKEMLRAMSLRGPQNPTFNLRVALGQVWDDPGVFQGNHGCLHISFTQVFWSVTQAPTVRRHMLDTVEEMGHLRHSSCQSFPVDSCFLQRLRVWPFESDQCGFWSWLCYLTLSFVTLSSYPAKTRDYNTLLGYFD